MGGGAAGAGRGCDGVASAVGGGEGAGGGPGAAVGGGFAAGAGTRGGIGGGADRAEGAGVRTDCAADRGAGTVVGGGDGRDALLRRAGRCLAFGRGICVDLGPAARTLTPSWGLGRPTSAGSGGSPGGFSAAWSSCNPASPTSTSATPFPAALHRTRTPLMHRKVASPAELSPRPPFYATALRSSAMSASCSSTQSPGFRE